MAEREFKGLILQDATSKRGRPDHHLKRSSSIIRGERIERRIFYLRGAKVILSSDLADLYGVTVKALNQAVSRNLDRFPSDFMFQLTRKEFNNLKSQIVTSSWGGIRRALPYAFTEQGIAMLSGVLKSPRAIRVNIEIMRAFVKLHRMLASNAELAHQVDELEKKYDRQFKIVFDAIRQLMTPPPARTKPIGFRPKALKK
jgi:hypothetical protein